MITVEGRPVLRTIYGCSREGGLRPQAFLPVAPALPHPNEPMAKAQL